MAAPNSGAPMAPVVARAARCTRLLLLATCDTH